MVQYPIAKNILIKTLHSFTYEKGSGEYEPHGILIGTEKVSKIKVAGAIIQEDLQATNSIEIDDGTATMQVRQYIDPATNVQIIKDVKIGDTVLVIGKIREYNDQRYIQADIVRKIDQEQLKYYHARAANESKKYDELQWQADKSKAAEQYGDGFSTAATIGEPTNKQTQQAQTATDNAPATQTTSSSAVNASGLSTDSIATTEQMPTSGEKSPIQNKSEMICTYIKEHDSDEGVDIQDIINDTKVENCEQVINDLLEAGEIFMVRPGRVKVLD